MENQDNGIRLKIGEQVRSAMKERGLTIAQLSELTGYNPSNLSRIMQGKYNVSIDILGNICEAMEKEVIIKDKE